MLQALCQYEETVGFVVSEGGIGTCSISVHRELMLDADMRDSWTCIYSCS